MNKGSDTRDGEVRFSIIVPVYNRRDEVEDLLESLSGQTVKNFETIIVEDGSSDPCGDIVERFSSKANARYQFRQNEGRSYARNAGIGMARGKYLVFFDSDCVIPPDYFAILTEQLDKDYSDCYGGPDSANESFSTTQRAINFAMTSFLTTGGIRGGRRSMEKFVPRSFNMGFSRDVADEIKGFREMFSEDIDISTRIRNAGFKTKLIPEAKVWHKRRVDFKKFFRQVHVFGMSRITLKLLYPGSLKAVHMLPAVAVVIGVLLLVASIVWSPWFLLPIGIYLMAILIAAIISTRSLKIGLLAVPASIIQICGYGSGFLRAWIDKIVLGHGRDINQEINMRRGK